MPQIYAKTSRAIPTKVADASQLQPRVSGYGELVTTPLSPTTYPLADEGSYFKAVNATPGTGIIHALTTAFSSTAALFCINNTDSEGAKRIYLDYVRLVTGATAISMTAATSIECAITIDSTNRYSSGGTAITPTNVNMDNSRATIATVNFGAVTLTAASGSARTVARMAFARRAAPAMVTGDQFYWDFGAANTPPMLSVAGAAAPATAATMFYSPMSPVIIGGGDSINFHLWYPSGATTAPTYEVEIGWWER
jgi:hypothetical protein